MKPDSSIMICTLNFIKRRLESTSLISRVIFLSVMAILVANAGLNTQSYATWYNNAQERIDSLRKGDFGIRILDRKGEPYSGEVSVRMIKHEFPSGIACDLYEGSGSMGNTYSTTETIQADSDAEIYQTERWNDYLVYAIPVESGKDYEITLKFAEIYFSAGGSRFFDVHVDGQLFLNDFDVFSVAGGRNKALDTSVVVTATKSNISIELTASLDNAAIKGIVVTEEGFFDPQASTVATREPWMKAAMYKYYNNGACGNSFKWSEIQPQHTAPNYTDFENAVRWTQRIDWDLGAHTLLWGGNDDLNINWWKFGNELSAIEGNFQEELPINAIYCNSTKYLKGTLPGDLIKIYNSPGQMIQSFRADSDPVRLNAVEGFVIIEVRRGQEHHVIESII